MTNFGALKLTSSGIFIALLLMAAPPVALSAEAHNNNQDSDKNDHQEGVGLTAPTQRDINLGVAAVIAGAVIVGAEHALTHKNRRKFSQS